MKVNNVSGYFNCRKYKKDVKRNEREMCGKDDRIDISLAFESVESMPADFVEFAKKSEKNEKFYVAVKAFPKNCKAYNAAAKQFEFPDNKHLDGGQFEMNIEYSIKHGTGTELNGVYANRIQFIKKVDEAFEAIEGGQDDIFNHGGSVVQQSGQSATVAAEVAETDLPF